MAIPLKQGLKRLLHDSNNAFSIVAVAIPLKQGLKHMGVGYGYSPMMTCRSGNSIKTRIETRDGGAIRC